MLTGRSGEDFAKGHFLLSVVLDKGGKLTGPKYLYVCFDPWQGGGGGGGRGSKCTAAHGGRMEEKAFTSIGAAQNCIWKQCEIAHGAEVALFNHLPVPPLLIRFCRTLSRAP